MGLFSRKKQDDILKTLPELPKEIEPLNLSPEKEFKESITKNDLNLNPIENLEPQQIQKDESEEIENFKNEKIGDLDMSNSLFDFPDEKDYGLEIEKKSRQIEPQKKFNIIQEQFKNHKYFFMTTNQCKDYLEILDNIRKVLKESSKNCAKLIEMKKSEEEELENLKKNFSKIENKFYEIDSIISKV